MLSTITSYKMLTHDVLELVLEVPEILAYTPGQWVLLAYPDPLGPIRRAYSIVKYESDGDYCFLTLSIKLREGGRWGEYLKRCAEGTDLEVMGIYGNFLLQETPAPKVFVGTGTGVAPLIAMATATEDAPKSLYFSVSYKTDLFYQDLIKAIPNLESHIHVTREQVAGCEEERIDLSKPNFLPESEFYLCGSPESVNSFADVLKSRGFTKIFIEKY